MIALRQGIVNSYQSYFISVIQKVRRLAIILLELRSASWYESRILIVLVVRSSGNSNSIRSNRIQCAGERRATWLCVESVPFESATSRLPDSQN